MKRFISLLIVLALLLGTVACGNNSVPAQALASTDAPAAPENPPATAPVAEEVKGVTIPAFSVLVNGVTVTQETMAAYPMYAVQAFSINSSGTESTTTYVGFAIKDVLKAAGLEETYIWLEAAADDGYAVTFTGDILYQDTTLLAVTRDGSPFGTSPWFAPCSDTTTGNYLKGMVSLLVNTTEGAPEIKAPAAQDAAPAGDAALTEGPPEILDRTDKVTFADFSFKVNDKEVTNKTLEGLHIYKITATAQNSKGQVSESGYTGYKLADVLEACGVSGYKAVKAVANDGYETEISGDLVASDYTLIAIEKDKELGEGGTVWLAPCMEQSTKSYCKLVVQIVAE